MTEAFQVWLYRQRAGWPALEPGRRGAAALLGFQGPAAPSALTNCQADTLSLGFIYEPGETCRSAFPDAGDWAVDQVGLNCAVCHTGTVRETPSSAAQIVLGMPAHQLDLQRFFRWRPRLHVWTSA